MNAPPWLPGSAPVREWLADDRYRSNLLGLASRSR